MDTCPSGSPPRVRPSVKRAAGTAPNGVDGDTWIQMSGDVSAARRESKNSSATKVPSSQEKPFQ